MNDKSKYNPLIHHRRSIRLKGYDYSQAGLYFITICCQNRACLFGKVTNSEMQLNDAGKMVENEWLKLPERFKNIQLHEYVVMPNHFHAILEIVGATLVVAPDDNPILTEMGLPQEIGRLPQEIGRPQGHAHTGKTVGAIVGAFQSIVTVEYIRGVKNLNWQPFNGKLWHRNYYEHIIRNEKSYHNISNYILNNPKNWRGDKFYPK